MLIAEEMALSAQVNRRFSRIAAAFSAHSLGNVVTLADRFFTVPLMLMLWGAETLGAWTIIRSVPAYLSVSEMGFASAAGNMMTTTVVEGDLARARVIYWSTRWLLRCIAVAGVSIIAAAVLIFPLSKYLNCEVVSQNVFGASVFLMGVYTVAVFQTQLLYALGRSVEKHVQVAFGIHITRIAEIVGGLGVMASGGGVLEVSLAYVFCRMAGIVIIDSWLKRNVNWVMPRQKFSKDLVLEMIRPAIGFAALPFVQSFQLQGVTLVLAMTSAPTIVLAYNSMRTLARLPVMIGLSVSRTAWPEMSAAIAKNDLPLLRRIFRNTFLIGLLSNIVCMALLSLLGRPIFEFWTNSKLQFDFWTFFLLCAGAAVSSFSMSTMSVLNAGNRHESSAIVWASVAALSLGVCFVFRHSLTGVGVSALLLFAEVLVSIFVLLASRSYLRRSATGVTAPAAV